MKRTRTAVIAVPALAAALFAGVLDVPPASADVTSTGVYRACTNYAAIRMTEDGPAIDNLKRHQRFVVQSGVGNNYVYGYKFINHVHGLVKASSLGKDC